MKYLRTILVLVIFATISAVGCKSSGGSGGLGILSPSDETAEAANLVAEANKDLTKIKVLYDQNENKREELKTAMEKNDAVAAKKIADEVVYLINDGSAFADSAVEKVQKAQEMQINPDYREYLRLKEESLKRQIAAFEEYRQAARTLRDNYDPKNVAMRDKVKADFKTHSDNYRRIMEEARDYSSRANELAKEAMQRQQSQ